MKLGACYNLFDGEELLEASLKSIRESVNYVAVLFQRTSNFGNAANADIEVLLSSFKLSGLIDDFFEYKPTVALKGHGNEIRKRNASLDICKAAGCTHFMSIDADEFYHKEQLDRVKEIIETDGYDSSACKMQTYYRTPEWAIVPPEEYFVPLIYKIDERTFSLGKQWPVPADPTRKLDAKNLILFTRDVIEMHHMSYVRKDIRIKLVNSSASVNFKDRIDILANYWKAWTPKMMAMLAGKEERLYDVRQVENVFKIDI